VWLEVQTSPDVDIAPKAEEICALAKELVEDRMGLQLEREVQVRIRHAPYAKGRTGLRPASSPPTLPTQVLEKPEKLAAEETTEQAGEDSRS